MTSYVPISQLQYLLHLAIFVYLTPPTSHLLPPHHLRLLLLRLIVLNF